ncbi:MAG TPA: hypothetical protein V6D28_23830 [Leptolyngbyaceae cyanobacterium]
MSKCDRTFPSSPKCDRLIHLTANKKLSYLPNNVNCIFGNNWIAAN